MIGLGRRQPTSATHAVGTAPVVARCEACRRTGTELESRVLDDSAVAGVCVDATGCRHHWAPADQPRGIR